MKLRYFFSFVLLCQIHCLAYSQTIFNQTRSTYHTTIQAAVNAALDGDKIIVSAGTYSGAGNRDINFGGKNLTLSGSGGSVIIDCAGTQSQPHRAFKFASGESYESVIEGFTIINGYAPTELCSDGNSYSAGGAIYCDNTSPIIKNCTFTNNESGNLGGAIFCYYSGAGISRCTFQDNTSAKGGAVFINLCDMFVYNCVFSQNDASAEGGAIYISKCTPLTLNCTFYNNRATVQAGGIRIANPYPQIYNSILWQNYAPANSQIGGNVPNDTSPLTVQYSDVEGGFWGLEVMDIDPHFVDPANNDFHLKSSVGRWDGEEWVYDELTSPCIDAGDLYSDWREELWPNGKRINMGAYGGTSQASMSDSTIGNIADLNNDDIVNNVDLMLMCEAWLSSEPLLKADMNRDSNVDFRDYLIFTDNRFWWEPQE
jgi:predicted outer membrane repeat protein